MPYIRICPECGVEILYTLERSLKAAAKKSSLCKSCAVSGSRHPLYGKKHPFNGQKQTDDFRIKQSLRATDKMHKYETLTSAERNELLNPTLTRICPLCKRLITYARKGGKTYAEKLDKPCLKCVKQHQQPLVDLWKEKYGEEIAIKRLFELRKSQSLRFSGQNNPRYGKPAAKGTGVGWQGWYKGWFFRSLKELSYAVVLDEQKQNWISAEQGDFRIKYQNHLGQERTYVADFLVEKRRLVEIKPTAFIKSSPLVEAKRKAAIEFCKNRGLEYVLTDVEMLPSNKLKELHKTGAVKFIARCEQLYMIKLRKEEAMEEIIIRIGKNGKVNLDVLGVKGTSCKDLTKNLERAFGAVEASKTTDEYYVEEQKVEDQQSTGAE